MSAITYGNVCLKYYMPSPQVQRLWFRCYGVGGVQPLVSLKSSPSDFNVRPIWKLPKSTGLDLRHSSVTCCPCGSELPIPLGLHLLTLEWVRWCTIHRYVIRINKTIRMNCWACSLTSPPPQILSECYYHHTVWSKIEKQVLVDSAPDLLDFKATVWMFASVTCVVGGLCANSLKGLWPREQRREALFLNHRVLIRSDCMLHGYYWSREWLMVTGCHGLIFAIIAWNICWGWAPLTQMH